MKYDEFIKKLENLKIPDIELPGHRQALRIALLNARRFRQRTVRNWAKAFAPVAVAVLLIAVVGVLTIDRSGLLYVGDNQIGKFASYEQLQRFVKTNTRYAGYYREKQFPPGFFREDRFVTQAPGPAEGFAPAPSAPDYSATNIQVAGVDEADIVKTDGNYIYFASGNKTTIVKAYPPEDAKVLSEIELEGIVLAIFINGDKLVLFEEEAPFYPYPGIRREGDFRIMPMPYRTPKTHVKIYDVSDRANPQLVREVSADSQHISSRMIGDYVYVVTNKPVYEEEGEVSLPKLSCGGKEKKISATDIYYSNVRDSYYMYTTVIAINTQNDAEEPTYKTIMLGASSTLYVSPSNIYLTFPVWRGETGDSERTTIHRLEIDGAEIEYVASGEVPGMVLNQFSMDEYDGFFRVATTVHGERPVNNVYVLNMALEITGQVIDLAEGETIYSARFMGKRGYLVTFRSVDPLFVIDLADPYAPKVLGELKVTGYSSYLHPYDENHLIGIGKETIAEREDFAWYQGVKISLFDVSDVTNPREISKYEIGDRGTESPVLWDHKAFLFDRSRNLMVIPVVEAKIDKSEYGGEVPPEAYGKPVWQGACVFDISLDGGIKERGRITHIDDIPDTEKEHYYYSPFAVERALYIRDVLYTISQAKIKMNSLGDLGYINEVKLSSSTWTPYEYLPEEPKEEVPPDTESGTEELPDK